MSQHYFIPAVETVAHAQACVDAVRDFWNALDESMAAGASWTVSGLVDSVEATSGVLEDTLVALDRTGVATVVGEFLPYQTQGLVTWRTAGIVNGRRVHGRTFIPYPSETLNVGGVPNGAYVAFLQAAGTALAASGTTELCVWHRPVLDSEGTVVEAGSPHAVTSAIGQPRWSVLRGRRS
jgi:hypothetical protein